MKGDVSEKVPTDVTFQRCELKFLATGQAPDVVSDILSTNLEPIQFGTEPESWVNSIYFDDHRLSAAEENLAGNNIRTKLRMRWYDRPLPEDKAFLEIKHRRNQLIKKQRINVQLPNLAERSFKELMRDLAPQLEELLPYSFIRFPQATVLVSYRRRHFIDPDTQSRVTLDYGLSAIDHIGCSRLTRCFEKKLGEHVLIEVKTRHETVSRARELIYPLRPKLTRFSKYLMSCRHMGWLQLRDSYY